MFEMIRAVRDEMKVAYPELVESGGAGKRYGGAGGGGAICAGNRERALRTNWQLLLAGSIV